MGWQSSTRGLSQILVEVKDGDKKVYELILGVFWEHVKPIVWISWFQKNFPTMRWLCIDVFSMASFSHMVRETLLGEWASRFWVIWR